MTTTILVGDVRERLNDIPAGSVQCCVTSPPYFGLRDYGTAQWDGGDAACDHAMPAIPHTGLQAAATASDGRKRNTSGTRAAKELQPYRDICGKCGAVRVDSQIGLEPTLAEYIAAMVEVFRGVKRVLRDDGVVWLNIGDSYNAHPGQRKETDKAGPKQMSNAGSPGAPSRHESGLKAKDLMMVPARLAIALQDDGWYLRSDIIWAKPNPMPESVTDRPTSAHEHIFLLTKSARYFYDADAVRESVSESTINDKRIGTERVPDYERAAERYGAGVNAATTMARNAVGNTNGRNLRNVWEITTQGFPGAHFATFPLEIPRRCIKAGTSQYGACSACGAPWRRVVERELVNTEGWGKATKDHHVAVQGSDAIARNGQGRAGDSRVTTTGWEPTCACNADVIPCTVLDPFLVSGTTLLVADQLGRNGIGIELNPVYAEMARERITGDAPMFASVEVDAA